MAANPLPGELDLPDDVAGSRPPLDLLTNEGRVALTGVLHKDPATAPWTRKRPWWAKPAIVFATACLLVFGAIGIVAVSSNGQPEFVEEPAPTTTATLPADSAAYDVTAVAVAPDGSLWAATDTGIVHWDLATGTQTLYSTGDGLPADDAFRVVVGADGTVWTGGSGWIARFDGSWTTFSAPEGPMAVGPDGAVWTAFGERDLARFDGSEWQTFEVPLSLDQGVAVPWTASLDVATDGTVWAGTNELRGVFAFDGANWSHYTSVDGLAAPLSGTVAAAPDGTVWVGSVSLDDSPGAGVARFDGSTWTVYTTAEGLLDDVPDVAVGADGTVWAIHQNGVSRFDGDTWTAFPGIAGLGMFASVDASGTLWMPARDGGVIGFDGTDLTRLEVPAQETPSPTTTMTGPAGTWNPILATTRAKPAPPAASCPAGIDPNTPGPADQERPEPGWVGNGAAAFDQHAGRIIYVDTLGETWAFDVCTNTWKNLHPAGAVLGDGVGGLVYDVDSDRIIALGETVNVYDPNENAWNPVSAAGESLLDFWPVGGAVYDPTSGLVVVQHGGIVKTYDVDTDRWTNVGTLSEDVGHFLAYIQSLDRIFTGEMLVDPRTGEITKVTGLPCCIAGGFGSLAYATSVDTAYVIKDDRRVCRFNPANLDWLCFGTPDHVESPYIVFAAMVGDPINQRLILINSVFGDFWVNATDDVWAIDLDSLEWNRLLAPSTP
jgi:hypothetical protein